MKFRLHAKLCQLSQLRHGELEFVWELAWEYPGEPPVRSIAGIKPQHINDQLELRVMRFTGESGGLQRVESESEENQADGLSQSGPLQEPLRQEPPR